MLRALVLKNGARVRLRLAENSASDAQAFVKLSNSLYERSVDENYYRWQFFQPSHPSRLLVAELEESGTAVGFYGYHLLQVQRGSDHWPMAMALDIMIAEPFQGQGLFRSLAEQALQPLEGSGPQACVGMANRHALDAHMKALGWQLIEALKCWEMDLSGEIPEPGALTLELQPAHAASWREVAASAEILRKRHPELFFLSRGEEHYRWRFAQNPRYSYFVARILRAHKLLGHAVLKTFVDPLSQRKSGDVVDLLLPGSSLAQDWKESFSALGRHFQSQGIDVMTSWMPALLSPASLDLDFAPTARSRYFCGRELGSMQLPASGFWYLTMMDSEVY